MSMLTVNGTGPLSWSNVAAAIGGWPVAPPLEMRADRNLIADVQLAIVKGLQPPPRRRAGKRPHAVLASLSSIPSIIRRIPLSHNGSEADKRRDRAAQSPVFSQQVPRG